MRVVDLDRDMRDVIPTGTSRDSEYLFDRMTFRTLDLAAAGPGRTVLDVASGLGQDARMLAAEGGVAVAAEPSTRMSELARTIDEEKGGACPVHVRGWGDALPFADDSFDASLCKGALDHFDAPRKAIAEMARVTRPEGHVILAIANFESLSCRAARAFDAWREGVVGRSLARGRRHYDVPHDHFTRYDLALMREQAEEHLVLDVVDGVSMAWGLPVWSRAVSRLPLRVAQRMLATLDAFARRVPALADVIVLAGRPRRETSSL
jgi:SAM-dependent methyltransferase